MGIPALRILDLSSNRFANIWNVDPMMEVVTTENPLKAKTFRDVSWA